MNFSDGMYVSMYVVCICEFVRVCVCLCLVSGISCVEYRFVW